MCLPELSRYAFSNSQADVNYSQHIQEDCFAAPYNFDTYLTPWHADMMPCMCFCGRLLLNFMTAPSLLFSSCVFPFCFAEL
jgi:hypothetical protein